MTEDNQYLDHYTAYEGTIKNKRRVKGDCSSYWMIQYEVEEGDAEITASSTYDPPEPISGVKESNRLDFSNGMLLLRTLLWAGNYPD